jgi:hypothetical protein
VLQPDWRQNGACVIVSRHEALLFMQSDAPQFR